MVSFSRQYFTTLRGTTYIALFNIGVMILNVMVGVLLGAEVLDSEFKKEGSWKVSLSIKWCKYPEKNIENPFMDSHLEIERAA